MQHDHEIARNTLVGSGHGGIRCRRLVDRNPGDLGLAALDEVVNMATKKRTTPKSPERKDIADLVISGMRSGLSAFKACEAAGVPQSTFCRWVDEDAELAEQYARAREDLIERLANETMAIADQAFAEIEEQELNAKGEPVVVKRKIAVDVQRAKLQVDTRKWLLSKLAPKKYGDKLELTGDPDRPLAIQKIERVVVK